MNKFAAAIAEKKGGQSVSAPVADIETFIQSAVSDGALTREDPVIVDVPTKAPESLLETLLNELDNLPTTIADYKKATGKKMKIQTPTMSLQTEQILKTKIMKVMIEEDIGVEISMSKFYTLMIDKQFALMMEKRQK